MSPQTWITIITAIISTGTAVFLAVITWRYVRLTREYVRLTQDILKATNKPKVILFLRYRERSISLCIQNIASGYASDIEFGGDLSFKTIDLYGREGKALKDIEPFKSGINFLGTGHKINTFLCEEADIRDLKKRSFKILVSYKDSAGKKFKQLFPFDLGNWENTSQFITPDTDDVANAIERVAGKLEQLRTQSSGQDKMTLVAQLRKAPEIELLERIANALEKLSSGK